MFRNWSAWVWFTFCYFVASTCQTTAADRTTQTNQAIQQIYDHSTTCYHRRDLAGYMAMFARNYVAVGVTGQKVNYLQSQAATARELTENDIGTSHYAIRSLVVQGGQAQGIVTHHYIVYHFHHKPTYSVMRNAIEKVFWIKQPNGWHLAAMQMVQDGIVYQRK